MTVKPFPTVSKAVSPTKKMEETLFLVLCQTQCGKKSMEVLGKKGTIADLTAAITFVPVHRNP